VSKRNRVRQPDREVHGVLLVDKPRGPTSHDIVALARRALCTSAVGHTGTLDPMATGLLVLVIGEATKLANYLSADDKEYEASLTLGSETDTLDAEGKKVKSVPVPEGLSIEPVEAAASRFRGAFKQIPPAVSAIKQSGVPMYIKARRGEAVAVMERDVIVHELRIVAVCDRRIDFFVRCSKGFYVRALARDLAKELGTVGHLSSLRRTSSGQFHLNQAVGIAELERAVTDEADRDSLAKHLLTLSDACSVIPRLVLTSEGCQDAQNGRPISLSKVLSGETSENQTGPIALFDNHHQLVAIARIEGASLKVERGFRRFAVT
jgi:tRNA pseudouridine55 synthase